MTHCPHCGEKLLGQMGPPRKLSASDRKKIRLAVKSATQTAVAKRFGVSRSLVCRILSGAR